jgi:hypothetical protein
VGVPLGEVLAIRAEPCSCPPMACACFHPGGPKSACCLHAAAAAAAGHGTSAHHAAIPTRQASHAGHPGHFGLASRQGGSMNPTSAAPTCGHGRAATGVPLDGRAVLATVAPTPAPAPAERLPALAVRSPSAPFRRPFTPPPRRPSRLA